MQTERRRESKESKEKCRKNVQEKRSVERIGEYLMWYTTVYTSFLQLIFFLYNNLQDNETY
jgi:hypothetical protein